jgi:peptide/nickel transport system substrate-binding protein
MTDDSTVPAPRLRVPMVLMDRRRALGLAASASAAAFLAACSSNVNGSDPGSGSVQTGAATSASASTGGSASSTSLDTLIIANAVKVDTLDPAQNAVNESIWIDQCLYSRLTQADPTGVRIEPDLASSWDISADQLTYTFHLRDAKFSDGSTITAADAVFSINRSRNLKGGWGFLLTPVKAVTATDPKTVTITLTVPHEPLLADLAMYAYAVLPEKSVTADKNFFTNPVTSGQFTISSYNPDTEIDLTVNPHYYGGAPKIKTVKIMVVTNDNTRVLQLQSKKVDIIENPPGNLLNQIAKDPGLKVALFPSTRVDFLQISTKVKPFNDVRVRQALKYAVDLDELNTLAYQGHGIPANSFMPYKMLYWDASLAAPKQDLVKSKSLLAAAGHAKGFDIDLITVSGDAAGSATAIVLQSQFAKVGITVNIQSFELVTAYTKEDGGTFATGERYWTNDIIDPDEVATFGADGNGGAEAFNSFWENKTASALVASARSETDTTKRAAMYAEIQQIVADQVPFLPLVYSPYRYAYGSWVTGFDVSPLGNYNQSLQTLTVAAH